MGMPMVVCRDIFDRALMADVDEPEIPRTTSATVNGLSHVGRTLQGARIAYPDFMIHAGIWGAESNYIVRLELGWRLPYPYVCNEIAQAGRTAS